MAYEIFTDSSANLPEDILEKYNIGVISLTYTANDQEYLCYEKGVKFNGAAFYNMLRNHVVARTSLANAGDFIVQFEPVLEEGKDILYIGMSSGISGTVQAARNAAVELNEKYPDRKIIIVDTLAASLGEGLQVCRGAELKEEGKHIEEVANIIEGEKMNMCQFFTVDDLMFLKRGGRLSNVSAFLGTLLNVKPILKGNEKGEIVTCGKVRGRKNALNHLAETVEKKIINPISQTIGIAHGDCLEDAKYLSNLIKQKISQIKNVLTVCYEPGTGAHVGPGTMALFFMGDSK